MKNLNKIFILLLINLFLLFRKNITTFIFKFCKNYLKLKKFNNNLNYKCKTINNFVKYLINKNDNLEFSSKIKIGINCHSLTNGGVERNTALSFIIFFFEKFKYSV